MACRALNAIQHAGRPSARAVPPPPPLGLTLLSSGWMHLLPLALQLTEACQVGMGQSREGMEGGTRQQRHGASLECLRGGCGRVPHPYTQYAQVALTRQCRKQTPLTRFSRASHALDGLLGLKCVRVASTVPESLALG